MVQLMLRVLGLVPALVATAPPAVPGAGTRAPGSAIVEVTLPLPVPRAVARRVWSPGVVHPVVQDDLSDQ